MKTPVCTWHGVCLFTIPVMLVMRDPFKKLSVVLACAFFLGVVACSSGGPSLPGEGLPEDPLVPPGEDLGQPDADPQVGDEGPVFVPPAAPGGGPAPDHNRDQNHNQDQDQDQDQDLDGGRGAGSPDDPPAAADDPPAATDDTQSDTSDTLATGDVPPTPEATEPKDFFDTAFYTTGPAQFIAAENGEIVGGPQLRWSIGPDTPDLVQIVAVPGTVVLTDAGIAGELPDPNAEGTGFPLLPHITYRLAVYDFSVSRRPIFPVADIVLGEVAALEAHPLSVTVASASGGAAEQALSPANAYQAEDFTIHWSFPNGLPPVVEGTIEVCLSRPKDAESLSPKRAAAAGLFGCAKDRCFNEGLCWADEEFHLSEEAAADHSELCGASQDLSGYQGVSDNWIPCNQGNENKKSPAGHFKCARENALYRWIPSRQGTGSFAGDYGSTSLNDDPVNRTRAPLPDRLPSESIRSTPIQPITTKAKCFPVTEAEGQYRFLPQEADRVLQYKIDYYYRINGQDIGKDQRAEWATVRKLRPTVSLEVVPPEINTTSIQMGTVNEYTIHYDVRNATEFSLVMMDPPLSVRDGSPLAVEGRIKSPRSGEWGLATNPLVNTTLTDFFTQSTKPRGPAYAGPIYRVAGGSLAARPGAEQPLIRLDETGSAKGSLKVRTKYFRSRFAIVAMGDSGHFTSLTRDGDNFKTVELPEPSVNDIVLSQARQDRLFGPYEAVISNITIRNALEARYEFTDPASCERSDFNQLTRIESGIWHGNARCAYQGMNPGFRFMVTDFTGAQRSYIIRYRGKDGAFGIDIPKTVLRCADPGQCFSTDLHSTTGENITLRFQLEEYEVGAPYPFKKVRFGADQDGCNPHDTEKDISNLHMSSVDQVILGYGVARDGKLCYKYSARAKKLDGTFTQATMLSKVPALEFSIDTFTGAVCPTQTQECTNYLVYRSCGSWSRETIEGNWTYRGKNTERIEISCDKGSLKGGEAATRNHQSYTGLLSHQYGTNASSTEIRCTVTAYGYEGQTESRDLGYHCSYSQGGATGWGWYGDPEDCAVIGGVTGAVLGAPFSAVGAAGGAALGYRLCTS